MKIGLEFEGVIRDRTTGEIARWSKMSDQTKRRIKTIMFPRRDALDPCDRYDALAEVRTAPIENPTAKQLIWALFEEMERASNAFNNNGYDIQWWEQQIPKALHDEIRTDFAADDPDGKKDKLTFSVKENGERYEYKSTDNLFRGGGLHINISHVPFPLAQGLMLWIHDGIEGYKGKYHFQSHYRTNFLYRTRYGNNILKDGEPATCIAEYMSHGFNMPTIRDWRERWNKSENESKKLGRNMSYGGPLPQYYFDTDMCWAIELLRVTKEYFDAAGKIK